MRTPRTSIIMPVYNTANTVITPYNPSETKQTPTLNCSS